MHAPVEVTIDAAGRDKGKTFVLQPMPAMFAEDWIWRAALGMIKGGVKITDQEIDTGVASLVDVMLNSFASIPADEAKILRYEMLPYIKIRMADGAPPRALTELQRPNNVDAYDIEEIQTWFYLRWRYWKQYQDFFAAAGKWILVLWAAANQMRKQSAAPTSPGSSTSQ